MYRQATGVLIVLLASVTVAAQSIQPGTVLGRQIVSGSSLIKTLLADTSFEIAKGVEETDLYYINSKGQPMHVFILKARPGKKHVRLKIVCADSVNGNREKLSDMISRSGHSHQIVAGVNADFFNMGTGASLGILYKDGIALKDTFTGGKEQQGLTYFGIQKRRRRLIIGSKGEQRPPLLDAAGGGVYLVKNYQAVPQTVPAVHPRTAVGITGQQVVYFVVADGRQASYSNGMDYQELSMLFKALKVKDAINLDGGGSSTFIIRHPQSHELEIRNRPSDGQERAISNGWVITSR